MMKLKKDKLVQFLGIFFLTWMMVLGLCVANVSSELTAADCRACHQDPAGLNQYLPDIHHYYLETAIPLDSILFTHPDPDIYYMHRDADEDGVDDSMYTCLNCHNLLWNESLNLWEFDSDFRNCMYCHIPHIDSVSIESVKGNDAGVITVIGAGFGAYDGTQGFLMFTEVIEGKGKKTVTTITQEICTILTWFDTETTAQCSGCGDSIGLSTSTVSLNAELQCDGIEKCDDNYDNDGDSAVDCEDQDCRKDPACK